jgi:Flp pilus assembly protein TadG
MFTRAAIDRAGSACLRGVASALRWPFRPLRWLLQLACAPLRCQRGSAQIEFPLVGPPFLLLLAGTLELSAMFFTSSVIEGASKEVARQIRTGQINEAADPLAAFQANLCDALFGVIDCTRVVFHVQTFGDFTSVSMPLEVDEDGEIVNTTFAPGGSEAVTVVRASYRWEFMTPLIGNLIPAGPGGHLLTSTVAFQNEPF